MFELLIECIFLANLLCSPNTIDPDWPRRLLTLRLIMDHKITLYTMLWGEMVWKGSVKFGAHIWNVGQVCIFIHKHRLIDGLDVAWMGGSALFFLLLGADMLHTDFQLRPEVELCLKILERLWYGTLLQQDSSYCSFCLEFCPPSGLRCPDEPKP